MTLIAIPGLETQMAGAIVFWRLSGPCNRQLFCDRWFAAGLDPAQAPEPVSVEVAVHRAATSMKAPGRLVWREKGSEAWTLATNGRRLDESVIHDVACRVSSAGGAWVSVEPPDHPWAPEIHTTFNRVLGELGPTDVSGWLVRQAERRHDAVSLRDTGGFYFIPPSRVPEWRRLAEVVNGATSHRVYEIPAMASDQAVAAVTDAIASEAAALAERMEEELRGGKLGERALESRKERCAEALAKIGRYEALLGTQLDVLKARVESLQAEAVAGILAAQDDEDEELAS